jgi:hypothetical protein
MSDPEARNRRVATAVATIASVGALAIAFIGSRDKDHVSTERVSPAAPDVETVKPDNGDHAVKPKIEQSPDGKIYVDPKDLFLTPPEELAKPTQEQLSDKTK